VRVAGGLALTSYTLGCGGLLDICLLGPKQCTAGWGPVILLHTAEWLAALLWVLLA
jgi:hypothetical protein